MLPKAYVAHTIKHRTRLRIPSRKGDPLFFSKVEQALEANAGVAYVDANPLSGRILLLHTADLAALIEDAQAQGLFMLETAPPARDVALNTAVSQLDRADRILRWVTRGHLTSMRRSLSSW